MSGFVEWTLAESDGEENQMDHGTSRTAVVTGRIIGAAEGIDPTGTSAVVVAADVAVEPANLEFSKRPASLHGPVCVPPGGRFGHPSHFVPAWCHRSNDQRGPAGVTGGEEQTWPGQNTKRSSKDENGGKLCKHPSCKRG